MEDLFSYANDENKWDDTLMGFCGVKPDTEGGGWGRYTKEALDYFLWTGREYTKRRVERAHKMYEIVLEEKRLAEEETRVRMGEKRKRYKERRRERLEKKELKGHG